MEIDLNKDLIDRNADRDNTPLTFGMHKGKTPNKIAEDHPGYIVWLYEAIVEQSFVSKALYDSCKQQVEANEPDEDINHDEAFMPVDKYMGRDC